MSKQNSEDQPSSPSEVETDDESTRTSLGDDSATIDPFDQTPKPRRRGLRIAAIAGVVLLVGAAGVFVLNARADDTEIAQAAEDAENQEDGEATAKVPIPVTAKAVAEGTISAYLTITGNLIAEHDVTVLGEAEGRVARMAVEEGQRVQQGQTLAELARGDAQIATEKASVKEGSARRALERARGMIEQELISREEFDKFTLDHEVARQELAEAQWGLAKTTIRAPFSGRVTRRIVQAGQHVRPGDELFQITDFEPMIARIHLPEKDILGLDEGREVRIVLNADSSVTFSGKIRQISPVVDTATGTVKVTVEATSPPSGVRPGSFVSIQIARETRSGALLLPREALLRELRTVHVFVAEGDFAVKREVEIGLEEEDFIQILAGVEAGELVIVAGQGGLKDGSSIKLMESAG